MPFASVTPTAFTTPSAETSSSMLPGVDRHDVEILSKVAANPKRTRHLRVVLNTKKQMISDMTPMARRKHPLLN